MLCKLCVLLHPRTADFEQGLSMDNVHMIDVCKLSKSNLAMEGDTGDMTGCMQCRQDPHVKLRSSTDTYTKPRMREVAWLMLAMPCVVILGVGGCSPFPGVSGKKMLAAVGMTRPMHASSSREQHALLSMVLNV